MVLSSFYEWSTGDVPESTDLKTERDIESSYVRFLESKGKHPSRQVHCWCGTADIVTDDEIYEVKKDLDHNALFKAVGQVLMYRLAINPYAAPKIVTNRIIVPSEMIGMANTLGIEVITWIESDQDRLRKQREDELDETVLRKLESAGDWVRVRHLHQAISHGVKTLDIRRSLGRLKDRGLVKSRIYGPKDIHDEWTLVKKG